MRRTCGSIGECLARAWLRSCRPVAAKAAKSKDGRDRGGSCGMGLVDQIPGLGGNLAPSWRWHSCSPCPSARRVPGGNGHFCSILQSGKFTYFILPQ